MENQAFLATTDFIVAAIQIPFIVQKPTRWLNWVALFLGCGIGIRVLVLS